MRSQSEECGRPARSPGLLGVLTQSSRIVASEIARRAIREDPPDFLIQIDVPAVGMFDLHRTNELVVAGRKAGFDRIAALRRLLYGESLPPVFETGTSPLLQQSAFARSDAM